MALRTSTIPPFPLPKISTSSLEAYLSRNLQSENLRSVTRISVHTGQSSHTIHQVRPLQLRKPLLPLHHPTHSTTFPFSCRRDEVAAHSVSVAVHCLMVAGDTGCTFRGHHLHQLSLQPLPPLIRVQKVIYMTTKSLQYVFLC